MGQNRKILPSCYTIRNRNSTTHVLMNWHFEASNDRVNWAVLDRRVYLTGHTEEDEQYAKLQKELCQKGHTSTWGIERDVYKMVGYEGFRYFRIVQIGQNSSGSNNLALSGFEIYGGNLSGRWP